MYRTTPISHDCSRSYPPQTVADCSCSDTVHSFTRNTATLFVRSLLTLPLRAKVHVSNLLVHFLFLFFLLTSLIPGILAIILLSCLACRSCAVPEMPDNTAGVEAVTVAGSVAHQIPVAQPVVTGNVPVAQPVVAGVAVASAAPPVAPPVAQPVVTTDAV